MGKKSGEHFVLMTEAGEKIKGLGDVWQAYPRPQMKREKWLSLNGIWELDGHTVRVPFPPESVLAEYNGQINEHMTYVKHFCWSDAEAGKRTLLHFGAVDQIAEVYLNGSYLGRHEGGYFPFTFDITEVFVPEEDNVLEVRVTDTLDRDFPYGKQRKDRGGMWYTPISGIWQSVWLEQVPETYVEKLKITPDKKGFHIAFGMKAAAKDAGISGENVGSTGSECVCLRCEKQIKVLLHNGETYTVSTKEDDIYIDLTKVKTVDGLAYEPKLWTVEEPYLYGLEITAGQDALESYVGLRTISIQEVKGINRVCLNDRPIFMHGVLDQGYFSDGIFTPAEEAEYERDVLRMKGIGLNMIRKHIKIEPECFYYYCDVHGMLVMQDMVSNGYYDYYRDTVIPTIGLTRKSDSGRKLNERQKRLFEEHMAETIEHLYNHPSIIAYTIFNEGWGQFESDRLYTEAKAQDPSRLYDSTSGWFIRKLNDFDSVHIYFGPRKPKPKKRPMFLSEFGGYSYAVQDHVFAQDAYGYGACENEEALFQRIYDRYAKLVFPYIKDGLCGSVYTQVSDVEDEINGFYTYDRKVAKVSPANMGKIADRIREELMKEAGTIKKLNTKEKSPRKEWYKLDLSAIVYPTLQRRDFSSVYRISCLVKEDVKPDVLQQALDMTLPRFPTYKTAMRKGVFWRYLEPNNRPGPFVQPDVRNPMQPMHYKTNNRYMIRVYYYQNRISLEAHHSLGDGNGGMCVFLTMVATYLRLLGHEISHGGLVLDIHEKPDPGELEDAYMKYANAKVCPPRPGEKTYRVRGTKEPYYTLNIIDGIMPVADAMKVAKSYGATLTEYLNAVLIYSLLQKQMSEHHIGLKPVRIAMPVNLRRFFPSITLRNFITMIYPGVDPRLGDFTFEEIVQHVHNYMQYHINEKFLRGDITTNAMTQKNPFIRVVPLFIKDFVVRQFYTKVQDRNSSAGLTNMGLLKLPEDMVPHVERIDIYMGQPFSSRTNCAIISYNGTLTINFASSIIEADVERFFFRKLVQDGIPVKIESNR